VNRFQQTSVTHAPSTNIPVACSARPERFSPRAMAPRMRVQPRQSITFSAMAARGLRLSTVVLSGMQERADAYGVRSTLFIFHPCAREPGAGRAGRAAQRRRRGRSPRAPTRWACGVMGLWGQGLWGLWGQGPVGSGLHFSFFAPGLASLARAGRAAQRNSLIAAVPHAPRPAAGHVAHRFRELNPGRPCHHPAPYPPRQSGASEK